MYTIQFNERETNEYRRNIAGLRRGYQQSADQQMASRLEAVRILAADGSVLYKNEQYKGAVSDLEWHERITQAE